MPSAMKLAGCFGFRSRKKNKHNAPLTPDNTRKQDGTTSNGEISKSDSLLDHTDLRSATSSRNKEEVHSNKKSILNSTSSDIPKISTHEDKVQTTLDTDMIIPTITQSTTNGAEHKDNIVPGSTKQRHNDVVTTKSTDTSLTENKNDHEDCERLNGNIAREVSVTNGTHSGRVKQSSDEIDLVVLPSESTNQTYRDALPAKKDGAWFLQVVGGAESQLLELCDTSQNDLEIQDEITDEVSGQMRAAIGKSKLLVNKKFKQFRGLCDKNLNQEPDEQFPTTSMDLAGFWDMVQLQVDEVLENFSDIDQIRKNNWKSCYQKNGTSTPTKTNGNINHNGDHIDHKVEQSGKHTLSSNIPSQTSPNSTPGRTPKKTPRKSPGPNTPSKLAEQRDEVRKRLMAAKQAMKGRRNSESEDMIFVTTN